jgi:hypothetical protein
MIGRLWHWISSLPPVVHAITALAVIAAASLAYAKRKAINAATESTANAKVGSSGHPNCGRSYEGRFQGYFEYSHYSRGCYFDLSQNGIEMKVAVTSRLSAIHSSGRS